MTFEAYGSMMREHDCHVCPSTDTAECDDPTCLIVPYRPERKRWCTEHRVTCTECKKTYCHGHADGWVVGGFCAECQMAKVQPRQELQLSEVA